MNVPGCRQGKLCNQLLKQSNVAGTFVPYDFIMTNLVSLHTFNWNNFFFFSYDSQVTNECRISKMQMRSSLSKAANRQRSKTTFSPSRWKSVKWLPVKFGNLDNVQKHTADPLLLYFKFLLATPWNAPCLATWVYIVLRWEIMTNIPPSLSEEEPSTKRHDDIFQMPSLVLMWKMLGQPISYFPLFLTLVEVDKKPRIVLIRLFNTLHHHPLIGELPNSF